MFLLIYFEKTGVCSGFVPGVFWVCSGIKSRLKLYSFKKKKLGRVVGVCSRCVILLHFIWKNLGVFCVCSGCVVFASFFFLKKWVCSGCVVIALFFYFLKNSGVCVLFLLTRFSANESRKALTQLYCVRWRILNYREFVELLLCRYLLKVSWIQNEFMRSSFLPKYQPKITEISALPSNKLPGQKSL